MLAQQAADAAMRAGHGHMDTCDLMLLHPRSSKGQCSRSWRVLINPKATANIVSERHFEVATWDRKWGS
jgi:hypothetical protein